MIFAGAPQDDVGMRMAGAVTIDRDPVKPGAEVLLHLPQGSRVQLLETRLTTDEAIQSMHVDAR